MTDIFKTDICVIGGGSGGLSVAATASQLGVSVMLIEHDKMGGNYLNRGCVPVKAILSAAKMAKTVRESKKFGIRIENQSTDYNDVHKHIQTVIKNIAPHDSAARFQNLGVHVIKGTASFIDEKTICVNDIHIQAKYFVIATGSLPFVPQIEGLETVHYLTNEDIFELTEKPEHLIIIGGEPFGCEIAQAHCLLGTKVSLLQRDEILSKDDPELTEIIREEFLKDGIELYENMEITLLKQREKEVEVTIQQHGALQILRGSHLLIASGRTPNITALNLEAAKIAYTKHGIKVNNKLRSSNKRVFAIGDASGGNHLTHIANYHAWIFIRNALFRWPTKRNHKSIPWITYTEPSLAHVGLHEINAKNLHKNIRIFRAHFSENDRAHIENESEGLIKIITTKHGRVLGASIVGHNIDELINVWTFAIQKKLKLRNIANALIPYPTRSDINKQVASFYYNQFFTSKWTKKIVRFLLRF